MQEFCARTDFFPGGVRVLELSDRHGFGLAVRVALKEVRTPFVMVVQHDRSFMR